MVDEKFSQYLDESNKRKIYLEQLGKENPE